MTTQSALAYAVEWVDAWNAHDLEKIFSSYSEDFTIESPLAKKLYAQSGRTIIGKSEVRQFWTLSLEKSPHVEFELLAVLVGVNSLALHLFNTSSNSKSMEIMSFNEEGKVCKSIVCYAV